MPKKTRKEKILSEARRIIQQSQNSQNIRTSESDKQMISERKLPYNYQVRTSQSVSNTLIKTDEKEFTVIKRDLIKTVMLTITAIVIELVLYWRIGAK